MTEIDLDPRGVEAGMKAAISLVNLKGFPSDQDFAESIIRAYLAEALRLRPMSEAPHDEEIILEDHKGYRHLGMVYLEPEGGECHSVDNERLVPLGHFRGWRPLLPNPTEPRP